MACAARLETSAPGVLAAGDMCEWDSGLHGRRLRIEHLEVARAQGARPPRACSAAREPFAEVPYFWSDLADWASAEWVGPGVPWEREVVRGDRRRGRVQRLARRRRARGRGADASGGGADLESARRLIAEKTDVGEAPLADADLEAL